MSKLTGLTLGSIAANQEYAGAVTPGLIDRAADSVLAGLDPKVAQAMRDIWASDMESEVAQTIFGASIARQQIGAYSAAGKLRHTVRQVLNEDEVAQITAAYPEFDLKFTPGQVHDHGLANVIRQLGTRLAVSSLPPGMKYKDIGGSVMYHVHAGDVNCVTVSPEVDYKDAARIMARDAELRQMLEDHRTGMVTASRASVMMARSILNSENKYVVSKMAQDDDTKASCGIMIHVYDIPMSDLPTIMEKSDMRVLEGEMHFSNDFFERNEGTLTSTGARYRIDRSDDTFHMGFVDSGAPWYVHKWSEFMRYGADQILAGERHRFSYKIIERRGDTIKFRVLRIGGAAVPDREQFYCTPLVDAVEVDGFELSALPKSDSRRLKRRTYTYPALTWEKMVRSAAIDINRGNFKLDSHIAAYKTLLVEHKYNGVAVNPVAIPTDQVAPLAAMSGAYAIAQMALTRKNIRGTIDLQMRDRNLVDESTFVKVSRLFFSAVSSNTGWLSQAISDVLDSTMSTPLSDVLGKLISVAPVPRYRQVPAEVFRDTLFPDAKAAPVDTTFREFALERADADALVNELRKQEEEDNKKAERRDTGKVAFFDEDDSSTKVGSTYAESKRSELVPVGSDGTVEVATRPSRVLPEHGMPPEWLELDNALADNAEEYHYDPLGHTVAERRAAILEAVRLTEMEIGEISDVTGSRFRRLCPGGVPSVELLKRHKEEWGAPDLWQVREGIIVSSVLGSTPDKFDYSGVYCPVPIDVGQGHTFLRSVRDLHYQGVSTTDGEPVVRTHVALEGDPYTGYVMTSKDFEVFNGPQIVVALKQALDMPLDFEFACVQGGPGAGKTYRIVQQWRPGDVVLTPLRKSAADSRDKLAEKHLLVPRAAVSTVDSVLCSVYRNGYTKQVSKVYFDEVYATSPGRAYAVVALMRAQRVIAYGDPRQILPIVRADARPLYRQVAANHVVFCSLVWRQVPKLLACISKYYDFKLRAVKQDREGEVRVVTSVAGLQPMKDCALLSMYQEGKKGIAALFPKHLDKIGTVHQAQGSTVDQVILFNFDTRVRRMDDPFNFVCNERYVDVAISRARYSFIYVCTNVNDDLVKQWTRNAADPRKVKAAGDVASAGRVVEML